MLAHPAARSLLTGGVENLVDQFAVAFFVSDGKDVSRNLDQVAVELTFVPFFEDFIQFPVGQSQAVLEDVIGFADQLHVAVLDAVVHHFDVVPGSGFTDPFAARDVVVLADLRTDGLQNVFNERPGFRMSAGHDARTFEGSFFAAGYSGTDETKTFFGEFDMATVGVDVIGVTTVDDDVALVEQRLQGIDDGVCSSAGLNHDHDPARRRQAVHEIFQRFVTVNPVSGPFLNDTFRTIAQAVDEFGHLLSRAVVNGDVEPFVGHVHDQVLSHDGKADEADIVVRHFEYSL